MSTERVKSEALHVFNYPLYAVDFVGTNSVVVAGGGGASKTGVPNRLDVVLLNKGQNSHYISLENKEGVSACIGGGLDTSPEAVMTLSVINSGCSTFITTLEGSKCVEYLASLKPGTTEQISVEKPSNGHLDESTDEECTVRQRKRSLGDGLPSHQSNGPISASDSQQFWEVVKLREFSVSADLWEGFSQSSGDLTRVEMDENPMPTCIASGGPGAGSCLAIGTDTGSVLLVDRYLTDSTPTPFYGSMKLFALHLDVSDGHAAGVSCVSLSCVEATSDEHKSPSEWPLLATVSSQPDWGNLRIWRTPSSSSGRPILFDSMTEPFATAACSSLTFLASAKLRPNGLTTAVNPSESAKSSYRFKHCHFLNYKPQTAGLAHTLATTIQPLRADRKSHSYLVIWAVPHELPHSSHPTESSGRLTPLAQMTLPQGHLPACLAIHPSRSRGFVGVGTMDGQVDVYFLAPTDHRLSRVYSMPNAHPTFVTALSFLPPLSDCCHANGSTSPSSTPTTSNLDSFQLVSVSVDRLLLWHPGPDYLRIGYLARGLVDPRSAGLFTRLAGHRYHIYLYSILIFLLSVLPVYLALFDALLGLWL